MAGERLPNPARVVLVVVEVSSVGAAGACARPTRLALRRIGKATPFAGRLRALTCERLGSQCGARFATSARSSFPPMGAFQTSAEVTSCRIVPTHSALMSGLSPSLHCTRRDLNPYGPFRTSGF